VRSKLTSPNVGFPDDLGQYFNSIVPADYDASKPVGTGPFKYESFSPGERSVFVKNADYWRPDEPLLDKLEIIDFPDDTARVNALLGGQVEAITNLPPAQIAQAKGNSALKVLVSETGAWQPFTMRVDAAPFSDVRVRQAMRLIADRQQMIQQALSGQGRPGNDLYAPFDPAYAKDLPQREQDIDQAKSLLKQAGQSDLRVELVTAPVYQGLVEAAQVLAQQASAAGVTVKVRKTDSGTFYGDNYLKWPFAQDFWFTRTYLAQVAQGSLKSSPFNETHWNDPEFVKLIDQARVELDEGKRTELLQAAQQIEHEHGGYIVWSFSNQIDAHSAKLSGFAPAKSGIPLTNYGFGKVGFAA
jgi:peptide/nickel transport system substrate-binding protein